LTGGHVLAHANSLANGGRLGPSWSGIAIAPGARLYTTTPIAIPNSGSPADQEAQFMALAASQVIHTNVAPTIGSLGVYSDGPLALTVGLHNSVTLTANTDITGTVTVNGMLALNGHKLTLSGNGVITLGADNSHVFNYDTDYINGAVSFANSSSALEFNSATAALDGLSNLPDEEVNYDSSGNRYNAGPVVIGVQNASSYHNIVAEFITPPGTVAGGPRDGSFMPGIGAVLQGYTYGSGADYISKTSRFVWTHSAYIP
jgi:hypothetical protein